MKDRRSSAGLTARPRVLVLALPPYRIGTRSRKGADEFARVADVRYIGLQGAGRTGSREEAGTFKFGDIESHQIRMTQPAPGANAMTQIRNLVRSYLPAFGRFARATLSSRAETVYVTHPALAWLAVLHQIRFRSRILVDVPERPGALRAKGSLATRVSRFEPFIFRRLARRTTLVSVAVPSDVDVLTGFGFKDAVPVRNAPLSSWRAPYVEPRQVLSGGLNCAVIGSIYETRGYEILFEAVAKCANEGVDVNLLVHGPARQAYADELLGLIDRLGIQDRVVWGGAIDSSQVSAAYLTADIGMVLYESVDPGNDGLSNKILECVSSGRPVIAGDMPENRAFVSKYGVGWLTGVDVDSLARALALVAHSSDTAEISERCRDLGDSELTWEHEFGPVLGAVAEASSGGGA